MAEWDSLEEFLSEDIELIILGIDPCVAGKNNILNITNESEDNFFNTNNIDLLGTFSFDKKIYNFDIDYNSDVSNNLSKVIDIKVNE